MVDVVINSFLNLEKLVNVIHKQMQMRKVHAVLQLDTVEIVQLTVIVNHVLITQNYNQTIKPPGEMMVDVVQDSLLYLENPVNVIQMQMRMRKVHAVLQLDIVEIVQLTVNVKVVLITQN